MDNDNKENNSGIESIKRSLLNQERFLVGFMQSEKIVKKHKMKILSAIIVIVIAIVGLYIKSNMDKNNLIESNQAYSELLKNPNNKEALDILKTNNKKLFNFYQVNMAMKNNNIALLESLKNNLDDSLKDLVSYKLASEKADVQALEDYSLIQQSSLKEFAILQIVYKFIKEGKYEKAKESLANISVTSSINEYAVVLNHFLITKINK